MTGANAAGGALEVEGIKLANKLVPEVLGKKVELVIVDNKSDKVEAASAAARLVEKEKVTAIAAAKAMGLGVCGVDMIISKRGPLVMEVNSSPGLEGIEKSTNINVAAKIMDYIEKNIKPSDSTSTVKRKIKKDTIGA